MVAILKSLPIFPTYQTNELAEVETTFVTLNVGKWVTLQSFADIPPSFLASNSGIIVHNTVWELQLLTLLLVRQLTWAEFYQHQVLQNASAHYDRDPAAYEAIIAKMLLDLPSITRGQRESDKMFVQFLKTTAFIPTSKAANSSMPGGLSRIEHLYDPSNADMQSLLQPEFFPSPGLHVPEILTIFRSLGLRTIIDWRGIVDCARSVEAIMITDRGDTESIVRKQQRAITLLQYLDDNIGRLLGEEKKHSTAPAQSSGFSLFGTISSFFQEKNDVSPNVKKEEMDLYIAQLRTISWIPILQNASDALMPWKFDTANASADALVVCLPPEQVAPSSDAWYCSATFGILLPPAVVREASLKRVLGWTGMYSVQTLAMQLRSMSAKFQMIQKLDASNEAQKQELKSSRQRLSTIVPEVYARLERSSDIESVRGYLEQSDWIWVGDMFVSLSKVAVTFPVHAAPYLYALPEEIKSYPRLLDVFPWKQTFSYRDYINTLRDMAIESGYQFASDNTAGTVSIGKSGTTKPLSEATIDVAIALVSLISNETVTTLQSHTIFVPDVNGNLVPSEELVNDDVPWLQGVENMNLRSSCRLIHPNISSKVAEKVGVKSMRLDILEKTKDNNLFGTAANSGFESFGQAESLTNRLKTILDLYPDGSQILNELVQNADDAGATSVKIVIDENTYPSESLMDGRLKPLQGPSLIFYNNATFTEADFKSLASVGQGSKIEKLATTGRFGLGFNSTYHLTDTPTFVSGEHFVFFDPHCAYVPGATMNQPGIKFRFTGTNLGGIFSNQFEPFYHCGFDMSRAYEGTMFRFPLRNIQQARSSGISRRSYKLEDLTAVVDQMIEQLPYILLFLRSVKNLEIYRCYEGQKEATLLFSAQAENQRMQTRGEMSLLDYFEKRSNPIQYSRDSFYAKLLATNDAMLPSVSIDKQITVEKYWDPFERAAEATMALEGTTAFQRTVVNRSILDYEYVFGLVGGGAKQLACSEQARHLKLVPFGGVAACTKRLTQQFAEDGPAAVESFFPIFHNGHAFCFLPLPIQTKLPVLINAYFELSSNRRDIWRGDDTKGEARLRSGKSSFYFGDTVTDIWAKLLLFCSCFRLE